MKTFRELKEDLQRKNLKRIVDSAKITIFNNRKASIANYGLGVVDGFEWAPPFETSLGSKEILDIVRNSKNAKIVSNEGDDVEGKFVVIFDKGIVGITISPNDYTESTFTKRPEGKSIKITPNTALYDVSVKETKTHYVISFRILGNHVGEVKHSKEDGDNNTFDVFVNLKLPETAHERMVFTRIAK